jgi:hypothetical protein
MSFEDTPVWRIYRHEDGRVEPVLAAWYTDHDEKRFLTRKTFGTEQSAAEWLKTFWEAYWRLM